MPPLPAVRPPVLSASFSETRDARSAGSRPKTTVLATASSARPPTTRRSTSTSSQPRMKRAMFGGIAARHACSAAQASGMAPSAPAIASVRLSITSSRMTRQRLAPSATRSASSFDRSAARTISRLATLTQASSSTSSVATCCTTRNAAAPMSTTDAASGIVLTVQPRLVAGYCCASRAAVAAISACACAGDAPSWSRPITDR